MQNSYNSCTARVLPKDWDPLQQLGLKTGPKLICLPKTIGSFIFRIDDLQIGNEMAILPNVFFNPLSLLLLPITFFISFKQIIILSITNVASAYYFRFIFSYSETRNPV